MESAPRPSERVGEILNESIEKAKALDTIREILIQAYLEFIKKKAVATYPNNPDSLSPASLRTDLRVCDETAELFRAVDNNFFSSDRTGGTDSRAFQEDIQREAENRLTLERDNAYLLHVYKETGDPKILLLMLPYEDRFPDDEQKFKAASAYRREVIRFAQFRQHKDRELASEVEYQEKITALIIQCKNNYPNSKAMSALKGDGTESKQDLSNAFLEKTIEDYGEDPRLIALRGTEFKVETLLEIEMELKDQNQQP